MIKPPSSVFPMTSNVQDGVKYNRPARLVEPELFSIVFIDSINENKRRGSKEDLVDLQWVETEILRRYKRTFYAYELLNRVPFMRNIWNQWKQFKSLGSTFEWDDLKWDRVCQEIFYASMFRYDPKLYTDDIEARWDQIFGDNVYITDGEFHGKILEYDITYDDVVANNRGNGLMKAEEGFAESRISLSSVSKKRSFDEVDTSSEEGESEESGSIMASHENTLDSGASADFSLETVFHIVCNLPGLDVCSDMSMFAMTLLEDENKRKIIALLPTAVAKLCYIKYLYSNKNGGVNMQTLQKTGPVTGFCKEPPLNSSEKGKMRMIDFLDSHETQFFDLFRMDRNTFHQLCGELESKYGLKSTKVMSVQEKVGIFVCILGKGFSKREVEERFKHTSAVVIRYFEEVLRAMDRLSVDMVKPKDPTFSETPSRMASDDKYMPHFKDCIGVIDCELIPVTVPEKDQLRYRGKRAVPTTNVLASCDFDFQFTYVLAGMEGSAHDARVFNDAIFTGKSRFPKPPTGTYYLVDKVIPERKGYLTPYLKTRYNQSEFKSAAPRGPKEIFNQAHSSLKSCIDKAFGFLKARWKILQNVPNYSSNDQDKTLARVIIATFALHNYILKNAINDPIFSKDQSLDFTARIPGSFQDEGSHVIESGVNARRAGEMSSIRDEITSSLMSAGRQSQV